ncbi:MAG: hypothetical protein MUE81_03160 [Thermoflexibacter sp.]|nr:hypothetical protein [Thermoflexibacter sp.]
MKTLDWKGITLCVVIATLIWFFNALNKTYTTRINLPVIFKTKQQDIVAVEEPPSSLEVEVTGQGWSLFRKNMGIGVEPVSIDLMNVLRVKYFPTKNFLPIFSIQYKDIRINQIVPDTIALNYNRVISKPIHLFLRPSQIQMRESYQVTSLIRLEPKEVIFTGASSLVNQLGDTLFLRIEEDEEISENYEKLIPIRYPKHPHLKPEINKVKVSFQVSLFVQHNQLIPIKTSGFPLDSSAYITENAVVLEYWLRKDKENRIRTDTLHAVVDFRTRNKLDSTLVPIVRLSKDFKNIRISPSKIKIHYGKHTKNRSNRGHRSG